MEETLIMEILCVMGGMMIGGTIIWILFQMGILEIYE
jgi:hypothetical protein